MNDEKKSSWERLYSSGAVESLPWFYPGLDPDFEQALESWGISGGQALDLCTGPGTQALALAQRVYRVTATDISGSAVEKASRLAREKGLEIAFQQNDIMDNRLERVFDFVIDRGCYHVFPLEQRAKYVPAVADLLKNGGLLLLKCFSNREKRSDGPYRISPGEIKKLFSSLFQIESIKHTVFQSGDGGREPKALFCVLRKRR